MHHNGFGLQVVVDGRPLPEFGHEGKTCVVAALGQDYAVRLFVPRVSADSVRYLAVLTVDGLDAISGKANHSEGPGYILSPCQHPFDIPGYRMTNDHVARFCFGKRNDEYASFLDAPTALGTVSVVFYEEHLITQHDSHLWPTLLSQTDPDSPPFCCRSLQHLDADLDQCLEHKVESSYFNRGREIRRFSIEYKLP